MISLACWGFAAAFAQDPEVPAPELPETQAETPPTPEQPPADPRDAEMFGTPAVDSRDAEMFGAPADSRDAEMFGSPVETANTPTETKPEAADLGIPLPTTTERDLMASIAARDDSLTIGGLLLQRLDASFPEETDFGDSLLSSNTLFDVYIDSRPNDRVRLYARGRLTHDMTVQTGDVSTYGTELRSTTVLLDQLWSKFDIEKKVFLTLGRQRVRWGVGRLWNPTDFLNQQALDPLNAVIFDTRTGVGLIKVHVPLEKANTNLYAFGNFEGARQLDDVGGALRAEVVFGGTEVTASAAIHKDQPLRLGADLSTGFWLVDFKLEGAVRHNDTGKYYAGTLDFDTFELPDQVDRSDEWIPQVMGGLEFSARYNAEDVLALGAEYFYNGAGYEGSDLYPWLIAQGVYRPFYLGQHYVGVYALLAAPGQWDDASFTFSGISNLSDKTYTTRLDYSQSVLTFLRLNFYTSVNFGGNGEFHYAIDIPAVETIPGLEEGISVPATRLSAGATASISF